MSGAGKNSLQLLRQVVEYGTKAKGFETVLNQACAVHFEFILNDYVQIIYRVITLAMSQSRSPHIKVVSGGEGTCVCKLKVTENDQNRGGTLHGGMIATLVDAVSTWALLTSEKQTAGVSVDMNISYMKAAKVGEDITIDAKTLKLGNRLAFLTVDITNNDGQLIAQGKHTKFIGG
ncbi:hypothetical protein KUTeg_022408 [Tegillarca granosa]|uniref:Thioesterase domain-containing protein n=1 Tax=Tegillarca granosa TaxID=220873 RepID=A0ABQ9E650_TEGGR|nr:hypothetical protein KUTeg_022408 [Tegillarca granosa]